MNLHIRSLRRNVETGFVKSILWFASKQSQDGKYRAERKGEQFLAPKSIDDPTFIEYKSIDFSTADGWLRNSLGEDGLKNIDEYLNAIIKQKSEQSEAMGFPWIDSVEFESQSAAPTPIRRTSFPVIQSE